MAQNAHPPQENTVNQPSKIVTETADALLALNAGTRLTHNEIYAQVEQQYALRKRKPTVGSFFAVVSIMERRGMTSATILGEIGYDFTAVEAA